MEFKLFDAHCDTLCRSMEGHPFFNGGSLLRNSGHTDLTRGRCFGQYAQFFAIFGDIQGSTMPLEKVFEEQYQIFSREMEFAQGAVIHCRTMEQARAAFAQGKMAAFLSVEGAEQLNCDLLRLEDAYHKGVRMINLTWNYENALSGSNHMAPEKGLTPLGVAFVRRMQELGMLVDVSHLSDPGFWDVARLSQEADIPFVASHSNCRALCPHKRNLTDEQLTTIIRCRGVVGMNFCGEFISQDIPTLEGVAAHVEHIWGLGGEQAVALGGDWDGCDLIPGVHDITDTEKLYELLLKRNHTEDKVRNFFFHNFERVVNEVCGM